MTEPQQESIGHEGAPAPAREDTAAMTDRQLAQAVLARTIRPRAAEIRRLAEAVVAKSGKKAAKKAKGDKERKLARIPGQPKKKKKKA